VNNSPRRKPGVRNWNTTMSDDNTLEQPQEKTPPRWQPLGAIDRRVAGVLAEKAKTTPDGYPMSISAIRAGCNQKSNRFPLMQLELDDVEASLERLRLLGAVGMIEGYGRVTKFRHYLYEWLGVEKVEMAVMTELLLRGAQTEGELRARASRMEPIADLPALRPILQSLVSKGLMISLTPEGRGHVVSHALYQPRELDNLRAQFSQERLGVAAVAESGSESAPGEHAAFAPRATPALRTAANFPGASAAEQELVEQLRRDIKELRTQLHQLRDEVHDLSARQQELDAGLNQLRTSLGG
jgi:uncharacterized protein